MKKIFVILIIGLMATGCALFERSDKATRKAKLHLKIGTGYLNGGNYPAALRNLLQSKQLNSQDPVVHNNLGLTYLARGKLSLAEKNIREAIQLEPRYTEARNNLGRVLIERGLYSSAIKELNVALKDLTYQFPQRTFINLGVAYFKKKQYIKSNKILKKSLIFSTNDCRAYHFYGRTLFELNKYKNAAEAFDNAINFCQKNNFDEPHYLSALSYYKIGQQERAVARLLELDKLYPMGKYRNKASQMLEMIK